MDAGHPELAKLDQAHQIDLWLQTAAKSVQHSELSRMLIGKAQVDKVGTQKALEIGTYKSFY